MLNEEEHLPKEDECTENEKLLQKEDEETVSVSPEDAAHDVSVDSVKYKEEDTLKHENERMLDEMLRMRAEMENSKKRLQRNFDERVKDVNKNLLLDIISLLDDFDRALESHNNTESIANDSAVLDGVKMISNQFLQVLENKWGLRQFYAVNVPFNPEEHEALASEHSNEIDSPMVAEIYMKGYKLHDTLLRPAKVKVLQPKQA